MSPKDLESVEPWRAALREGDPALGAPDLDPQEVERMRRAVLAAAEEEPKRRRFAFPLWVPVTAVLALALGLWSILGRPKPVEEVRVTQTVPSTPYVPPPAPNLPVEPAPQVQTAEVIPQPEPTEPEPSVAPPVPPREAVTRVARVEEPAPDLPGSEDLSVPLPVEEQRAEALPRQVQFSTPGGTRIIWMLDPETNPIDEAAPERPEETE